MDTMNLIPNIFSALLKKTETILSINSDQLIHKRNQQMKFMHEINRNGKGGVCIGYQVIENKGEDKKLLSRELRISTAFCSEKDVYCKKTGREKVTNNMNTGNYITMPIKGTLHARRNRIHTYLPLLALDLSALFQGQNNGN